MIASQSRSRRCRLLHARSSNACVTPSTATIPAALGYATSDRQAKLEIDGFSKAVAERFGERTFLTNAARVPSGPVFESIAKGRQLEAKARLAEAWPFMRAAQQLAAQERTTETLKQVEKLTISQRQAPAIKQ